MSSQNYSNDRPYPGESPELRKPLLPPSAHDPNYESAFTFEDLALRLRHVSSTGEDWESRLHALFSTESGKTAEGAVSKRFVYSNPDAALQSLQQYAPLSYERLMSRAASDPNFDPREFVRSLVTHSSLSGLSEHEKDLWHILTLIDRYKGHPEGYGLQAVTLFDQLIARGDSQAGDTGTSVQGASQAEDIGTSARRSFRRGR